jgi:hypothetical protein
LYHSYDISTKSWLYSPLAHEHVTYDTETAYGPFGPPNALAMAGTLFPTGTLLTSEPSGQSLESDRSTLLLSSNDEIQKLRRMSTSSDSMGMGWYHSRQLHLRATTCITSDYNFGGEREGETTGRNYHLTRRG